MAPYGELCTAFYDLDKPSAPEDALAFLTCQIAQSPGPVFEPMCGSGRFLVPLLRQGITVEGLDASPAMLQACRDRCAQENLTPVLYEGALESAMPSKTYGLIFVLAGSFCLITDRQAAERSLDLLVSRLLPGGRLILEVETTAGMTPGPFPWRSHRVDCPDGAELICRSQCTYHSVEQIGRVQTIYELVQDGQLRAQEYEAMSIRHYPLAEFDALLRGKRLIDITCLRPYTTQPADDGDEAVLFVCRKP